MKVIYFRDIAYPSDSLYKEAKVLDIRQSFCYTLLCRQHLHRAELVQIEHDHLTRFKQTSSRIPKPEKTITKRSYYYLGPKIYNKLPVEIKKLNSIYQFKKKVRFWLESRNRIETHKLIDTYQQIS